MVDEVNRQCPRCGSYSVGRVQKRGSLAGGLILLAVGGVLFWQLLPSPAARIGLWVGVFGIVLIGRALFPSRKMYCAECGHTWRPERYWEERKKEEERQRGHGPGDDWWQH